MSSSGGGSSNGRGSVAWPPSSADNANNNASNSSSSIALTELPTQSSSASAAVVGSGGGAGGGGLHMTDSDSNGTASHNAPKADVSKTVHSNSSAKSSHIMMTDNDTETETDASVALAQVASSVAYPNGSRAGEIAATVASLSKAATTLSVTERENACGNALDAPVLPPAAAAALANTLLARSFTSWYHVGPSAATLHSQVAPHGHSDAHGSSDRAHRFGPLNDSSIHGDGSGISAPLSVRGGIKGVATNGGSKGTTADSGRVFGCSHYRRSVLVWAPCCGQFVPCRYCHNEAVAGEHLLEAPAVTQVLCMPCVEARVGAIAHRLVNISITGNNDNSGDDTDETNTDLNNNSNSSLCANANASSCETSVPFAVNGNNDTRSDTKKRSNYYCACACNVSGARASAESVLSNAGAGLPRPPPLPPTASGNRSELALSGDGSSVHATSDSVNTSSSRGCCPFPCFSRSKSVCSNINSDDNCNDDAESFVNGPGTSILAAAAAAAATISIDVSFARPNANAMSDASTAGAHTNKECKYCRSRRLASTSAFNTQANVDGNRSRVSSANNKKASVLFSQQTPPVTRARIIAASAIASLPQAHFATLCADLSKHISAADAANVALPTPFAPRTTHPFVTAACGGAAAASLPPAAAAAAAAAASSSPPTSPTTKLAPLPWPVTAAAAVANTALLTPALLSLLGVSPQPVAAACRDCSTGFGAYTCLPCRLFDDEPGRAITHCDKCGLCRRGAASDMSHCDTCNICFYIVRNPATGAVIRAHDDAACVPDALSGGCAVCCEAFAESRRPVHRLRCGHVLHQSCFRRAAAAGGTQCPTCRRSTLLQCPQLLWSEIDAYLSRTQMPEQWLGWVGTVSCNDCQWLGPVPWHFTYNKCGGCGGYNTSVLKKSPPGASSAVANGASGHGDSQSQGLSSSSRASSGSSSSSSSGSSGVDASVAVVANVVANNSVDDSAVNASAARVSGNSQQQVSVASNRPPMSMSVPLEVAAAAAAATVSEVLRAAVTQYQEQRRHQQLQEQLPPGPQSQQQQLAQQQQQTHNSVNNSANTSSSSSARAGHSNAVGRSPFQSQSHVHSHSHARVQAHAPSVSRRHPHVHTRAPEQSPIDSHAQSQSQSQALLSLPQLPAAAPSLLQSESQQDQELALEFGLELEQDQRGESPVTHDTRVPNTGTHAAQSIAAAARTSPVPVAPVRNYAHTRAGAEEDEEKKGDGGDAVLRRDSHGGSRG